MKIRKFIPIIIFVFTIIQGAFLIITSEKAQQQKEKLVVNQLTFAGECGNDHAGCENKEEQRTVTCWNGEVKNCTFQTKFSYDPCADSHVDDSCGSNYGGPSCTQCGEQIIGDCDCPAQPPTATPVPLPTSTPTPYSPPPTIYLPTPIPTSTTTPINTPTPTTTPIPTNTPTPTPIPTTPPGQPTNTPAPTATNTPGPSATPVPVLCGTKDCDNTTNPCRSGYICVQANDGSNYCTSPDFQTACKANPSYNNCCTAPGAPTATPTEIVLAKISPTTTKLLQTSTPQLFIYIIPALIMLLGLIL